MDMETVENFTIATPETDAPAAPAVTESTPQFEELKELAAQAATATPPKERSIQQVQQEYGTLCGMLGECRYQIQVFEENAGRLIARLKDVNQEAKVYQDREAAKVQADQANHDKQVIENYKAAEEKRQRKAAATPAKTETTN